jgi:hypothetical protein
MNVRVIGACLAFTLVCASVSALDAKADGQSPQPPAKPATETVMTETDGNGDGRIDYVVYFLRNGHKEHEEFDFNKDSVMDDFIYYTEGIMVREEIDSDFDGKIDIRIFIAEGKYIRRYERDMNGDGVADIVKDFDKK